MDYAKAFHLVAKAFKKATVPCVLVGGFAINFYRVTRSTLDIDFLITKEDFVKIKKVLIAGGYAEEFITDVAVRFSNKKEALDIDFMIVDDQTREKIVQDGKSVEIVGEKLVIPSINHLIALKLHAIKCNQKNRVWKDLPDIIRLVQMNHMDYKGKPFKELCLKYGNHAIYRMIMEGCGG
ncbi:MAG: nucleotidyl transferase AbiEii/AbiGii toxin family protein [Candidatus Omnitrophota bacterium]